MAKSPTARVAKIRHSPMEHPALQYPEETAALSAIAERCGLVEAIKWGKPCFHRDGSNIVLIQRFNDFVALLFFQGALLKDPKKLLHRVGSQHAPRTLRFANAAEVAHNEAAIESYIREAIALDAAGAKVPRKPVTDLAMPEELRRTLAADRELKAAFEALTPGRRKHYIFEIAAAKQTATRTARVEKYAPRILAGKGLRD